MNSSVLLDSSAAPAPANQLPQFSAPTNQKEGESCAPFGAVLEQLTAESADDAEAEEIDTELPELPIEENVEDDDSLANIIPFVCVCPPPDIIPLPTIPEGEMLVAAPVEGEAPAAPATTQPAPQAVEVPAEFIEATEPDAETKLEIADSLKPRQGRGVNRRIQKTDIAEKAVGSKGVELDPEIFKQVHPEPLQLAPLQILKGPEGPRPAPLPATHGTVVAQQVKAMKNGDKSAEISPELVQKMPSREVFRRMAPESSRLEALMLTADFSADTKTEFQINPTFETTPVKSLDAVRLVETIRTEVTQLRQRGDVSMSVVLRPDNGTELKIEISISRDGSVQAHARCERGDFQSLNGQWSQLQQTLSVHGIRMSDLGNQGDAQQRQQQSHNQNFERGNNPQQREQQHHRTFEEELAAPSTRFPAGKPFQKSAAAARRWQSWA